ncbi:MAG: hypothetical protein H6R10_3183 [Rhodocyclaceae bacterium]|nr:hypothetical protein [Rhodocyclaceae bacterium]
MNDLFVRSWRVLGAHGVIAIVFGVLAFMWPNITLLVLVALFAAYALVRGVVYVAGALALIWLIRNGGRVWPQ